MRDTGRNFVYVTNPLSLSDPFGLQASDPIQACYTRGVDVCPALAGRLTLCLYYRLGIVNVGNDPILKDYMGNLCSQRIECWCFGCQIGKSWPNGFTQDDNSIVIKYSFNIEVETKVIGGADVTAFIIRAIGNPNGMNSHNNRSNLGNSGDQCCPCAREQVGDSVGGTLLHEGFHSSCQVEATNKENCEHKDAPGYTDEDYDEAAEKMKNCLGGNKDACDAAGKFLSDKIGNKKP